MASLMAMLTEHTCLELRKQHLANSQYCHIFAKGGIIWWNGTKNEQNRVHKLSLALMQTFVQFSCEYVKKGLQNQNPQNHENSCFKAIWPLTLFFI